MAHSMIVMMMPTRASSRARERARRTTNGAAGASVDLLPSVDEPAYIQSYQHGIYKSRGLRIKF